MGESGLIGREPLRWEGRCQDYGSHGSRATVRYAGKRFKVG
jgi:hypothetical protein